MVCLGVVCVLCLGVVCLGVVCLGVVCLSVGCEVSVSEEKQWYMNCACVFDMCGA